MYDKKVAILGAGISGLAYAWNLKKHYPEMDVHIYEKAHRPGGFVETACHSGNLFEWGPRSIRAQDAEAILPLIEDMELTKDLIFAHPASRARYVLINQQLQPVPMGLWDLVSSPLGRSCLPAFFRDLIRRRSLHEDESVYDFMARRFSSKIADSLVDPLVKGIFAGDAKQLSMRCCFPAIWEMEQQSRSLILGGVKKALTSKKTKGMKGIVTIKQGLGALIDGLAERLQPRLNCAVEHLAFRDDKVIITINGKEATYDQVVSTLPAFGLAKILPKSRLAELLQLIPFASVSVVHLYYKQAHLPCRGFGYLVPAFENEQILGVVFDSEAFPEQNKTPDELRLTVMIKGEGTEENLKEIAIDAVSRHLSIHHKPDIAAVRTAMQAIPQYPVGFHSHRQAIMEAKEEFPLLSLAGISFNGISLNSAVKYVG